VSPIQRPAKAHRAPPHSKEGLSHWQAAQDAQKRGDYGTGAREYHEVIARSPRFAEAYQNPGLSYQLEERLLDAMQAFLKALALEPELPGANPVSGQWRFNFGAGTDGASRERGSGRKLQRRDTSGLAS
jgi:tetratricopeptide (TPR) repeat protein